MDLRPGNEGEDLSHLKSGWDVLPLCPAVCQICLFDVAFFTCLQTLVIFAEISVLTGLALLGVVLALKVHKARPYLWVCLVAGQLYQQTMGFKLNSIFIVLVMHAG